MQTTNTRAKAAVPIVTVIITLNATLGPYWSFLTHGPPVESTHEGQDAVVRAPGSLEPRNTVIGHCCGSWGLCATLQTWRDGSPREELGILVANWTPRLYT